MKQNNFKDCQKFSTRILHVVIITFVLSLPSVEAHLIIYKLSIDYIKKILLFNFSTKY